MKPYKTVYTHYTSIPGMGCVVHYYYIGGRPEKINAPMEDCYPEEPAEIEIIAIKEEEKLINEILDVHEHDYEYYEEQY